MSDAHPDHAPIITWFRRDLRLADNPALHEAAMSGRPVIPLYILDETKEVRAPGAASLWWLDKSLRALAADLEKRGSKLILRRGEAAKILREIVENTGAKAVVWNRLYDPGLVDRDTALKKALGEDGIEAKSCNAALLTEPWVLKTKAGEPYKVFTPFWRALRAEVGDFTLGHAPATLVPPPRWPTCESLDDWALHPTKPDWSKGFEVWTPGEAGAHARLGAFIDHDLADYPRTRDEPGDDATSRLSPHLHFGEIGPRQVWRAVEAAAHRHANLAAAADKYLAELAWRDFNHELLFHRPDLPTKSFKPAYDAFPWRTDTAGLEAWKHGLTGYPMVDAGMRQMWGMGFMHNRVRMIVASFLIKHLLVDWREGEAWFWDTLVDADEANNVGNWQWVAGSGADASPFFRIFNPIGQGEKFDADGAYVRRWIPEIAKLDNDVIHSPWTASTEALNRAGVTLGKTYPKPIVEHSFARKRALEALKAIKA